jgi:ABC-type glycerol-3-phosphate transport system substrate-binding protein
MLNRRDFLKASALTAAGLVAAGCGAPAAPAPSESTEAPAAATEAPAAAAPSGEAVTLDIMSPLSEYEAPYREIWNVFEASHPDIKVNLFSINEDTAAAHEAKVAGGWLPSFENTQELQILASTDNYELFVDLSSFDFPWWDRFTFDVKNTWPEMYGLPGPRTLSIFQGYVGTWQYNADLMDKAGLDPINDVKSWDDMKKWLDEGTAWTAGEPDVDHFWNQAWHNWWFGMNLMDEIALAFPDGQRDRQIECFMGEAKFNAPDSPYRHIYEFYKEANDKGWIPESFWTRQWEGDMEAAYIAGNSVMMLHGPWVWDKALAAGSTFEQRGIPMTPPAEGQSPWVQGAASPNIDMDFFIRAGNEEAPHWEQTKTAWNWFFSPEAVPIRAQAEGRKVLYKLDEPLELKGPQYTYVLKEIGEPGGLWEDAVWEEGITGVVKAGPYLKKGAKGVWDWAANGNNVVFADVLQGKITVQDALDMAQRNWEESYEGLPA